MNCLGLCPIPIVYPLFHLVPEPSRMRMSAHFLSVDDIVEESARPGQVCHTDYWPTCICITYKHTNTKPIIHSLLVWNLAVSSTVASGFEV